VVKLRVCYRDEDLLLFHGSQVEVLHDGKLGSWTYHNGARAVICIVPIPPSDISRIATYDLHQLFCT
jgi:hypothetical protein